MDTLNTAVLTEYDFIVLLDTSGSMSTNDLSGGRTRWEGMQESVLSFVRDVEKFDADGIDVITFSGSSVDTILGVTSKSVEDGFNTRSPRGSTPLAQALTAALAAAGKSDKKDFILVFTDGVPDDQAAAEQVIIDASHKQETDDALTILFVQVGYDKAATEYLRKLDDNLTGAKFDIVDAKTIEEAEKFPTTAALIVHAIND